MGQRRFPVVVRLFGLVTSWVVVAGLLTFVPGMMPAAVADPLPPAQVSLTTDKIEFLAGETFTLTAVVDQPLEDTSSVLTIRDVTGNADVKECSSGAECKVELSFLSGGPREYVAVVGTLESQTVTVARAAWMVVLEVDQQEVGAGEVATLTATLNQDLGATEGTFTATIFDVISGKRVHTCSTGGTCAVQVSAYAERVASSEYVAAVFSASDTGSQTVAETQDTQASSSAVVVSRRTWSVDTTADVEVLWPTQRATITVSADQDVAETNGLYSIYIFEMNHDVFVAQCDVGRECVGTATWAEADLRLEALPLDRWRLSRVRESHRTEERSRRRVQRTHIE